MSETKIALVVNNTDQKIRFVNNQNVKHNVTVDAGESEALKGILRRGITVPWYNPPRFRPFSKCHIEIVVGSEPCLYIWQQKDYVWWTDYLKNNLPDEPRYMNWFVPCRWKKTTDHP